MKSNLLEYKDFPAPYQTNEERWQAVQNRDIGADDRFYYSVRTTGIYCRPSCGARLALRENVDFHDCPAQAEKAGFRPCKRCKPNLPSLTAHHRATITKICRLIEQTDDTQSLAELAAQANLSPYHFHRLFKSVTGLTPKSYAQANRAARVRNELQNSTTITQAIYEAGFNSNGRFYAMSADTLGMTPKDFRSGGHRQTIAFATAPCSLGFILVAMTTRGICTITLGDDPNALHDNLRKQFSQAQIISGDKTLADILSNILEMVEHPKTGLDLPLDIQGTAFQQRVWNALRQIPLGHTASYTDIAKKIGAPKSVRAVAQACAANNLAVAIPCHRVVRSDGSLSGYRWGIERKESLIKRERKARKD